MPLMAAAAALAAASPSPPPNMVLMLVDELGTGDVPWADWEIHAPTIQRLATQEGIRLGTAYAWQWCAPTRGASAWPTLALANKKGF